MQASEKHLFSKLGPRKVGLALSHLDTSQSDSALATKLRSFCMEVADGVALGPSGKRDSKTLCKTLTAKPSGLASLFIALVTCWMVLKLQAREAWSTNKLSKPGRFVKSLPMRLTSTHSSRANAFLNASTCESSSRWPT